MHRVRGCIPLRARVGCVNAVGPRERSPEVVGVQFRIAGLQEELLNIEGPSKTACSGGRKDKKQSYLVPVQVEICRQALDVVWLEYVQALRRGRAKQECSRQRGQEPSPRPLVGAGVTLPPVPAFWGFFPFSHIVEPA